MPSFSLITNVKIPDEKAFAKEFSKLGAETLKNPEQFVSVNITYNESLTFGGTFDPAFLLNITSLDNLSDPKVNEQYSKTFFEFFKEKLGIPENRGYISFHDPGRANLGYNGTTFAVIFGQKNQ